MAPAGVVEMREMLRDLAENHGVTVFVSSHILSEVARIATRIGIIHKGRLIKQLDANKLELRQSLVIGVRNHHATHSALAAARFAVRTCEDGTFQIDDKRAIEHPDEIASLLVSAGTPPIRLIVEGENLESYFLRLVGMEGGQPA